MSHTPFRRMIKVLQLQMIFGAAPALALILVAGGISPRTVTAQSLLWPLTASYVLVWRMNETQSRSAAAVRQTIARQNRPISRPAAAQNGLWSSRYECPVTLSPALAVVLCRAP